MYHGDVVPGFPQHPHRGFETVTIVRRGLIDHSDSLGAAARFGGGDVQWLTAGAGIVHSEMFPLLDRVGPNPLELFQIWLNLPAADKLVPPHFSMLWSGDIPTLREGGARITLVAGELDGKRAPTPPPHSWAARAESQVAIWGVSLDAGARWTLPPAGHPQARRTLYVFEGALEVDDTEAKDAAVSLRPDAEARLEAVGGPVEALLLQGRPIAEPVMQYGPFVMNRAEEIHSALSDYQRTRFGGWPWPSDDPNHGPAETRFARHADGRVERPAH
jgi:hypothetical protein